MSKRIIDFHILVEQNELVMPRRYKVVVSTNKQHVDIVNSHAGTDWFLELQTYLQREFFTTIIPTTTNNTITTTTTTSNEPIRTRLNNQYFCEITTITSKIKDRDEEVDILLRHDQDSNKIAAFGKTDVGSKEIHVLLVPIVV
jgi:hypothetical protein